MTFSRPGSGAGAEPLRQAGAKRGDNFISSELFVLAALESRSTLTDLLKTAGATTANVTQAIEKMRGESVNDQEPKTNVRL